jgi:GNAT superfamily N-acetyltransferase
VTGEVTLAETADEIARCFAVMAHLRPSLVEPDFVARVRAQQAEGYRLAYLVDDFAVVAVAGFRVMEMLATGRTMYVDDLVTEETRRSLGYGKTMLDWLEAQAGAEGCGTLSLDSGTFRHDAHAFYFRERMRVTSFHFAKKVE